MRNEKGERTLRSEVPNGTLPLFIGGGDHEVVRGCLKTSTNIKTQALHTDKTIPNSPFAKTKPILAKTISIFSETISNRISI